MNATIPKAVDKLINTATVLLTEGHLALNNPLRLIYQ